MKGKHVVYSTSNRVYVMEPLSCLFISWLIQSAGIYDKSKTILMYVDWKFKHEGINT